MANLKAASPLRRRIVVSLLDFMNSVEPTSSVPKSVSRVQFFSSQPGQDNGNKSDQTREKFEEDTSNKNRERISYPYFNLNDYPSARDEDRQIMKLINEYNRKNRDIIDKKKSMGNGERVSDDQMENLGDLLKSVCQMYGGGGGGGGDIKVEKQNIKETRDNNDKNNNKNNSSHGN